MRRLVDGAVPPNSFIIHIGPNDPPHGLAAINNTIRDIISREDLAEPTLRVCTALSCGVRMTKLDQVRRYLFDLL